MRAAASYRKLALPFHERCFTSPKVLRYFQPLAPPDEANLVNPQISPPFFTGLSSSGIVFLTPFPRSSHQAYYRLWPCSILPALPPPFLFFPLFFPCLINSSPPLKFLLWPHFFQEEEPDQFSKPRYPLDVSSNFSKSKGVSSCPSGLHFIEEETEAKRGPCDK